MSAARFTGAYPADWKAISRRVRDEAGNRCIRCGHPDGDRAKRNPLPKGVEPGPLWEPVILTFARCDERCSHPRDARLRMLTVHHLDNDKANVAWWNLLALCQICHLEVQARVLPERAWLWEHTAWFKPYVAGFYASYFGGQQITRAEAEADLDRWLALGQPHLYTSSLPRSGGAADA